jgi:hypothetical protein
LAIKESHMSKDEMIKDKKHYMDMRFWVSLFPINNVVIYCIYIYIILMWTCIYIYPEELAKTLDCWPSLNYYITSCKYVSMCSFRMYL